MEGDGGLGEVNGSCSDALWSYFVVSEKHGGKALCKICRRTYDLETDRLKKHVETCCKKTEGWCTRPSKQPRPDPSNTNLAEPSLPHPAEDRSWSSQEECGSDFDLARMIAFHGYPSTIVEDDCFRSFLSGLNPKFQMPSRVAIEDICHRHATDAMDELKETLAHFSGQINLATGTVEIGQGRALYMACQFIDDDWAFQKRIMEVFKVVRFPPYNHSALLGAEEVSLEMAEGILKQFLLPRTSVTLEAAVRRWGLQGRISSVAWGQELEKCLERKDFLDDLCSFVQVGEGSIEITVVFCVTYASDVLDSIGAKLHGALNPQYEDACFKTVKGLRMSHEKRTRNFTELGLNHVGTYDKRWYSYYCALEVLHKEYSESNPALQEQPKFNESQILELFTRSTPKEIESRLRNVVQQSKLKESLLTDLVRKILGTTWRAIETISSPSCPTANLCLEELMKLRTVLQSEANDASTVITKAVAYAKLGGFSGGKDAHVVLLELKDVLDSYLKEAYLYLSIPAVLDPCFKLEYVSTILNEIFGSEAAATHISRVKERIEDIFKEHRRKLQGIINGEGTSRMTLTAGILGTAAVDADGNEEEEEESITELERYLTDGLVPRREDGGFDVLMWWKGNNCRYPTVASMARDALAMPASDVLSPEHIARVRSMMSNYCITYPQAP